MNSKNKTQVKEFIKDKKRQDVASRTFDINIYTIAIISV